MASEYQQALAALYGTDPVLQQEANIWLNDFQSKPQAWGAALTNLDATSPTEFMFFSANVLLKKTKSVDWARLPSDQREHLRIAVRWRNSFLDAQYC